MIQRTAKPHRIRPLIDEREKVRAQGRFGTDRGGYQGMLSIPALARNRMSGERSGRRSCVDMRNHHVIPTRTRVLPKWKTVEVPQAHATNRAEEVVGSYSCRRIGPAPCIDVSACDPVTGPRRLPAGVSRTARCRSNRVLRLTCIASLP
jgi:hypothetical protein